MASGITVDEAIGSSCRLGELRIDGLTVRPSSRSLRDSMRDEAEILREKYGAETVGNIERVTAVRTMYRHLHMDPHHTRPSSEALLRRVLRGDDLPSVNCVVDAANLWSVMTLCPIGLYDAAQLSGPVTLRFGKDGEGYEGIRKEWINVSNRPVLVDDKGPFGNPTADSLRTAVTESTAELLAVTFQPPKFPMDEVEELEEAIRAGQVGYDTQTSTTTSA